LEVELSGFLQKKNSKGFYQYRYFKTQRHMLHYWTTDKEASESETPASSSFDMTEIKSIEKNLNKRIFTLYFMNDKFKLELKTLSDESFLEWTELIVAKRALYSVSQLLTDLNAEKGLQFQSPLFKTLLLMKEKDRVDWIVSKFDEVFSNESSKSNDNEIAALRGCLVCIEDMIQLCALCQTELAQGDPKINAHCKNFIFRYADVLKGTIVLELSGLVSFQKGKKRLSDMSEKVSFTDIAFIDNLHITLYDLLSSVSCFQIYNNTFSYSTTSIEGTMSSHITHGSRLCPEKLHLCPSRLRVFA
jgi:hypothetical protein